MDNKTKIPPWNTVDTEIEEIAQRILLELESASSTDLSDATYAKMILNLSDVYYTKSLLRHVETIASEDKMEIGKRAIIKVLLLSTWLQRLYFIIRSAIMGQIGTVLTAIIILFLGKIDFIQGFIIGFFIFVFALVITRLFDSQITKVTKKTVIYLAGHKATRDFIMNHF